MININFVKTPTPAMHKALKQWYFISMLAVTILIISIASAHYHHLRALRSAQQQHALLMQQKHEWDTHIEQHEQLVKQQKKLQDALATINTIQQQQTQLIATLDALKKKSDTAHSSLQSIQLSTDKKIALTLRCTSPDRACTLSQTLAEIPTLNNIKMSALTPHSIAEKESYTLTLKGILK